MSYAGPLAALQTSSSEVRCRMMKACDRRSQAHSPPPTRRCGTRRRGSGSYAQAEVLRGALGGDAKRAGDLPAPRGLWLGRATCSPQFSVGIRSSVLALAEERDGVSAKIRPAHLLHLAPCPLGQPEHGSQVKERERDTQDERYDQHDELRAGHRQLVPGLHSNGVGVCQGLLLTGRRGRAPAQASMGSSLRPATRKATAGRRYRGGTLPAQFGRYARLRTPHPQSSGQSQPVLFPRAVVNLVEQRPVRGSGRENAPRRAGKGEDHLAVLACNHCRRASFKFAGLHAVR